VSASLCITRQPCSAYAARALHYSMYHVAPRRSMGSWYHSLAIVVTSGRSWEPEATTDDPAYHHLGLQVSQPMLLRISS